MTESRLAWFLFGFPLALTANYSSEKLTNLIEQLSPRHDLNKLLKKSFEATCRLRAKQVDPDSEQLVKQIRKVVVKHDLLEIAIGDCRTKPISLVESRGRDEIVDELTSCLIGELSRHFPVDDETLIRRIIYDMTSLYRAKFFKEIPTDQASKEALESVLEMGDIRDITIDIRREMVSKGEFDQLRKLVESHSAGSPDLCALSKKHSAYVRRLFRYIEFRGISPKISGKNLKVELKSIYTPITLAHGVDSPSREEQEFLYWAGHGEGIRPLDLLSKQHRVVVLGDPGAGKSTILRYLALEISSITRKTSPLYGCVPVQIRLAEYSQARNKHGWTIQDYLLKGIDSEFSELFSDALVRSKLVFLLDGLDEVSTVRERITITQEIDKLHAKFPYIRILATSRVVGYNQSPLNPEFDTFTVQPFGRDAIEQFCSQWDKSIALQSKETVDADNTESLIKAIVDSQSVMKLASNPLLMTIIAMVHYRGKKLPSRRVELYQIATETFLEHWVQLRFNSDSDLSDKHQVLEVLSPIAYQLHSDHPDGLIEVDTLRDVFTKIFGEIHTSASKEDISREFKSFISFVESEAGYFYEKGFNDNDKQVYGFMHQTFQEYLTAIEIVGLWAHDKAGLAAKVHDSRWSEVLRLAAAQIHLSNPGRLGRQTASKFIGEIIDTEDILSGSKIGLGLASKCLKDEVSVTDDLRADVIQRVKEGCRSDHPALARTSIRQLFDLLDTEQIVEYASEIDDLNFHHFFYKQPSIWRLLDSPELLSKFSPDYDHVASSIRFDSDNNTSLIKLNWLGESGWLGNAITPDRQRKAIENLVAHLAYNADSKQAIHAISNVRRNFDTKARDLFDGLLLHKTSDVGEGSIQMLNEVVGESEIRRKWDKNYGAPASDSKGRHAVRTSRDSITFVELRGGTDNFFVDIRPLDCSLGFRIEFPLADKSRPLSEILGDCPKALLADATHVVSTLRGPTSDPVSNEEILMRMIETGDLLFISVGEWQKELGKAIEKSVAGDERLVELFRRRIDNTIEVLNFYRTSSSITDAVTPKKIEESAGLEVFLRILLSYWNGQTPPDQLCTEYARSLEDPSAEEFDVAYRLVAPNEVSNPFRILQTMISRVLG